jgi:hypothetical protein
MMLKNPDKTGGEEAEPLPDDELPVEDDIKDSAEAAGDAPPGGRSLFRRDAPAAQKDAARAALRALGVDSEATEAAITAAVEEQRARWSIRRRLNITVERCVQLAADLLRKRAAARQADERLRRERAREAEIRRAEQDLLRRAAEEAKRRATGPATADPAMPTSNELLRELHLSRLRRQHGQQRTAESARPTLRPPTAQDGLDQWKEFARLIEPLADPLTHPKLYVLQQLRRHVWIPTELEELAAIERNIDLIATVVRDDYARRARLVDVPEDPFDYSDPLEEFQTRRLLEESGAQAAPMLQAPTAAVNAPRQQGRGPRIVRLGDIRQAPPAPGATADHYAEGVRYATRLDRQAKAFDVVGYGLCQLTDALLTACGASNADAMTKLRVVFVWIVNHIVYAPTARFQDVLNRDNDHGGTDAGYRRVAESVLETRDAVCAGFSILLREMVHHAGAGTCDYVGGWTKFHKLAWGSATTEQQQSGDIQRHAWNIVTIDGRAYFCDSTWCARSDRAADDATDVYYLVPPFQAVYNNLPSDPEDQHAASPEQRWTLERFLQEPCLYPHFFRGRMELDNRETEWSSYRRTLRRSDPALVTTLRLHFREPAADRLRTGEGPITNMWSCHGGLRLFFATSIFECTHRQRAARQDDSRVSYRWFDFARQRLALADPGNDGAMWLAEIPGLRITPPDAVTAQHRITHVLLELFVTALSPPTVRQPRSHSVMDVIFELVD